MHRSLRCPFEKPNDHVEPGKKAEHDHDEQECATQVQNDEIAQKTS
jgi:hypothetical protein